LGSTKQTMKHAWARVTRKVRVQAQGAYARDSCVTSRMRYINTFLLSNIWYTAQMLPAPNTCTQKLTTAISWYISRGAVFRVPVSTLQRPKQMGGYAMTDIVAKFTAVFFYRMNMQGNRDGSATAAWLQTWNLTVRHANPTHATKFPTKLAYLNIYAVNMAYITPPAHNEAPRCFRRRTYS